MASLLCVIGLLGCNDRNRLTLDKIVELSAKGEDLNWSDFEQYESKDVGSGLYIYYYDIDDTFGPNITKFFQTARDKPKIKISVKC